MALVGIRCRQRHADFHRLPPSISAKHCPLGRRHDMRRLDQRHAVAADAVLRVDVKAVLPVGSELSVAPLITAVA